MFFVCMVVGGCYEEGILVILLLCHICWLFVGFFIARVVLHVGCCMWGVTLLHVQCHLLHGMCSVTSSTACVWCFFTTDEQVGAMFSLVLGATCVFFPCEPSLLWILLQSLPPLCIAFSGWFLYIEHECVTS